VIRLRAGIILSRKECGEKIDKSVFPGMQGGPLMHVIAAKAVCFKEAMSPSFSAYQDQIVRNAKVLAYFFTELGFRLVAGGTDTHLMLIDLTNKNLTGKQAQAVLDEVGIVVNKNMIPFDTQKPFITSGIRIGTPSVTTRGMKEPEMQMIAELIARVLAEPDDPSTKESVGRDVKALCDSFPIYGGSN
jgi:glycine hydroxymethyltransferase